MMSVKRDGSFDAFGSSSLRLTILTIHQLITEIAPHYSTFIYAFVSLRAITAALGVSLAVREYLILRQRFFVEEMERPRFAFLNIALKWESRAAEK